MQECKVVRASEGGRRVTAVDPVALASSRSAVGGRRDP